MRSPAPGVELTASAAGLGCGLLVGLAACGLFMSSPTLALLLIAVATSLVTRPTAPRG